MKPSFLSLTKKNQLPTEYLMLILAWVFWGTSQGFLRIESNETLNEWFIMAVAMVHAIVLFFANLLVIRSFEKIWAYMKNTWLQYACMALVLVFISLASVFINVTFYRWSHGYEELLREFSRYMTSSLEKVTFIGGFSTMFFLIRSQKEYQKQKTIIEEAQQTARDAQLQMLQQQLNPHFLFNTLNSLRSLISIDRERARDMVTDLSEFLRVTLSSYKSVKNTVQDEIGLLEYYLKIQKVRFEEELDYSIEIQEDLREFTLPKFILQPLVENAVKYGMLTSPMPLRLSVSAIQQDDEIKLVVQNTGKLADNRVEKHSNNGIANTRARLALMYGDRTSFQLSEQEGMVKAEVIIKKEVSI